MRDLQTMQRATRMFTAVYRQIKQAGIVAAQSQVVKFVLGLGVCAFVQSCGADSNEDINGEIIAAEVIDGSKGLAFVGQDVGGNSDSAVLYYYDFAEGEIREVVSGLQQDSTPFLNELAGEDLYVFERRGPLQYRSVSLSTDQATTPKELSVQTQSDPWAISGLATDVAVLANRKDGSLAVLDLVSGSTLQLITKTEVGLLAFVPTAVYFNKASSNVFVLSQGVSSGSFTNAHLIKFDFSNKKLALNTSITLPLSLPTQWLGAENSTIKTIVGLCIKGATGCLQGAIQINLSTMEYSNLNLQEGFFYQNGFAQGSSSSKIFAAVINGSDERSIRSFDLNDGTSTVIHTYDNDADQLYTLAFDPVSGTLLVGDEGVNSGVLHLYAESGDGLGSTSLLRRPYFSVLVP